MGTYADRPKADLWTCPFGNKWNKGDTLLLDQAAIRLRRMQAGLLAGAHHIDRWFHHGGRRGRVAFITLTYRPGEVYEPRDISEFLRRVRQWCGVRGVPFVGVWKLEVQQRGAPHYHVMLWLPRGITPPLPDKQGWWRKGASNAGWCGFSRRRGKRIGNPVGYLAKYLSKSEVGELPRGARLWGMVGAPLVARLAVGFAKAPAWLRERAWWAFQGEPEAAEQFPPIQVRKRGAWWGIPGIGLEFRSPWMVDQVFGGSPVLVYVGFDAYSVRGWCGEGA